MIHQFTTDLNGATLIELVATSLSISKKAAKRHIDAQEVFVNGRCVWIASYALKPGDLVTIVKEANFLPRIQILFEDEELLIVNKPPGILTNGDQSFEKEIRDSKGYPELLAVHRLDRDTSGAVLFSKKRSIKPSLDALFVEREVDKLYEAIVEGRFPRTLSEITLPLEGKTARTLPKVVSSNAQASYLRIKIETGRTHQIRRHMLSVGHSVLGDREYKGRGVLWPIRRQMLHASELSFFHPLTKKRLEINAPLPEDFTDCLRLFELFEPESNLSHKRN